MKNWLKKLASLVMSQQGDECTCADVLDLDRAVDKRICPCQEIRETPESPQKPPVEHVLTAEQTHLA